MRLLLATCLYLSTIFAAINYFTLTEVRDGLDFITPKGAPAILSDYSLTTKDPNTGNRTDCLLSFSGTEYTNVKPSTWV